MPEGTRGNQSLSQTHRVLPETHRWIHENSNTFSKPTQRSKRRERTSPRVYGGRRNAEKKAITKYPIYLLGSSFEIKVVGDHQSLQYLKKGREAGCRIARWAMALSEYNYQIEYLPGKRTY